MDFIVRETTQLGVKKIVPVLSQRVIPQINEEKILRWRKIAQESSKVARRTIVPAILPFTKFEDALKIKKRALIRNRVVKGSLIKSCE